VHQIARFPDGELKITNHKIPTFQNRKSFSYAKVRRCCLLERLRQHFLQMKLVSNHFRIVLQVFNVLLLRKTRPAGTLFDNLPSC
jgi:hypothetical protein